MTSTPVDFVCLKWGSKYGPEYVNRLYGSLLKTYSKAFSFHCYTDDSAGLRSGVLIRDIAALRSVKNSCFTMEKLFLFGERFENPVCLLDIDILVQSDLAPYFESYSFTEPRFAISARDFETIDFVKIAPLLAQYGTCYVNSSFVTWRDADLEWMIEFYLSNKEIIDLKYRDLDTFLYQTVLRKMNFHPKSLLYSYNHDARRKPSPIVLFNTSHGQGVELHQGPKWALDLWKSYDA